MPIATDLTLIAGRMQCQEDQPTVDSLRRQELRGQTVNADRLPWLIVDTLYDRHWNYAETTGLVLLTLDADDEGPEAVKQRVAQLPQTALAFTAHSGRQVHVAMHCAPADGQWPADEAAHHRFLAKARETARCFVEATCHCRVAETPRDTGPDGPTGWHGAGPYTGGPHSSDATTGGTHTGGTHSSERLVGGCRLSSDATAFCNPKAVALPVVGTGMLPAIADYRRQAAADGAAARLRQQADQEFFVCMKHALLDGAEPTDVVTQLAGHCHRAGLSEEVCIQRTLHHPRIALDGELVRSIFQSVYARPPQGRLTSQMSHKELIARRVEDFFRRRYELRYNEMKQTEEFRQRGAVSAPWLPLTDRDLRRIAFEEMKDVGVAWSIDIELYVRSSLVPSWNPLHSYLGQLPRWDRRTDYIAQTARRVPTTWRFWPEAFRRWLLAMVAQWLAMSSDHGNALVPMLIGPQGTRKTTFCRQLLPRELREYFIDDVKMDNAEQVERLLSRMALVCIDEYNSKTVREQAKIKRLLTEHDVQSRRMRSDQYQLRRRMASFIANTNETQPLTDPTGSRRYLCCPVSGIIDTVTPLCHQQLYAQALYELEHGERYHLTPDEEALLTEHNQQFLELSSPVVILTSFFEPAPRDKQYFLRAVDIQAELRRHVRSADVPNIKALTMALKAAGFHYGCMGQHGWYAKIK